MGTLTSAREKKKFQWCPYSETTSWYPVAFTAPRRRRPRATSGTTDRRRSLSGLEEKGCEYSDGKLLTPETLEAHGKLRRSRAIGTILPSLYLPHRAPLPIGRALKAPLQPVLTETSVRSQKGVAKGYLSRFRVSGAVSPLTMTKTPTPTSMRPQPYVSVLAKRRGKAWVSTARIAMAVDMKMFALERKHVRKHLSIAIVRAAHRRISRSASPLKLE